MFYLILFIVENGIEIFTSHITIDKHVAQNQPTER